MLCLRVSKCWEKKKNTLHVPRITKAMEKDHLWETNTQASQVTYRLIHVRGWQLFSVEVSLRVYMILGVQLSSSVLIQPLLGQVRDRIHVKKMKKSHLHNGQLPKL